MNPVQQSKIDYLIKLRRAHYDTVIQWREYTAGEQTIQLTDDQRAQLVGDDGPNPEFVLNICETILGVETDRLEAQAITVTVGDNEELSDQVSQQAWSYWKRNRLDEGQQNAHYAACRDGDSYAIVDFEKTDLFPRVSVHQQYDGKTSGVDIYYQDDDPQRPLAARKIWIAKEDDKGTIRRKNLYYTDRVEKWILEGSSDSVFADANWRPLRYGDDDWNEALAEVPPVEPRRVDELATVAWWTETGTAPAYNSAGEWAGGGMPLGLPVFHFRHQARGTAYGISSIADVVPGLQDAINRAGLAIQTAAMLNGFKSMWATKFDGKNISLNWGPGHMVYNPQDGAFGQFSETDLRQLIEVKDSFIKDAASLTHTPLSFFNTTGQIPAEGTQQQLELGLLAKTRRNQTSFGNTWEDVTRMMLKLAKVWTPDLAALPMELIDELEINCEWESAQVRNQLQEAQIAEIHERLGVPRKYIWRLLQYTEDEIELFEREADMKRSDVLSVLNQRKLAMEQQNEAMTALVRSGNGANNAANREPAATGA